MEGSPMAGTRTGSTVPRRQLGRYLRRARAEAGLTVAGAAKALGWSDQKIWRLETGQTSANPFDVEGMCRLFGTSDEVRTALAGLARETKARGWWRAQGDVVPRDFDLFLGLEEAASEITSFQTQLVPGLLQTSDYARVLMSTGHPRADEAEIERRVAIRLTRQAVVTRAVDPPQLLVVLSEAVLRQRVGSPAVMAFQLRRLVESTDLPNVEIRVAPFAARLHLGVLTSPFVLWRFPSDATGATDREPPVVHIEHRVGELYLDQPDEVERYDATVQDLLAVTDDAGSRELIAATMRELRE
jgi:transcriptional regulator with XRE-family HTH domain